MITLRDDRESFKSRVRLSWRNSEGEECLYKIYRRKIGDTVGTKFDEEFKPISACDLTNSNENISVLNIHPNCGEYITFKDSFGEDIKIRESQILKKWINESVDNKGITDYGMGRIKITSISVSEFNKNSESTLYIKEGIPRYDVICIGFFNAFGYANEDEQFTLESANSIGEYIDKGLSVLVGHDVISGINGSNIGLGVIRSKFGLKLGQWDTNKVSGCDEGYKFSYGGCNISIKNKSSITSYPWYLGKKGETIKITKTHTTSQITEGSIIFSFIPDFIENENLLSEDKKERANSYLSTYNSTALIQIGHSLDITDIERKILVNTIFSMKTTLRHTVFIDSTGADDEDPLKPYIENHSINKDNNTVTFEFRGTENGVELEYYVEALYINSGNIDRSNIVQVKYESGIKIYKCSLERVSTEDSHTNSDEWIDCKERFFNSDELKKGYYSFKVKTIDKELNESDYQELVFFMPGAVKREKSEAITKTPLAQRVNHRYRGPHESSKADSVVVQIKNNIKILKDIVKILDSKSCVMKERPDINNTESEELIRAIESLDKNIRVRKDEDTNE